MGQKYGAKIWGQNMGPKYGAKIWGQNMGPKYGAALQSGAKEYAEERKIMGPKYGAKIWGQNMGPPLVMGVSPYKIEKK